MAGAAEAFPASARRTADEGRDEQPTAEPFVLPGATHMLQLENPRGMIDGLIAFPERHPLAAEAARAARRPGGLLPSQITGLAG